MKGLILLILAILTIYAQADQASLIVALGDDSSCAAAEFRNLKGDGSDAECKACSKSTFTGVYSVALATSSDGDHPLCCSSDTNIVCRAMMAAYKKGCQAVGDHGISGTCAA
jgi:hypothetical protein